MFHVYCYQGCTGVGQCKQDALFPMHDKWEHKLKNNSHGFHDIIVKRLFFIFLGYCYQACTQVGQCKQDTLFPMHDKWEHQLKNKSHDYHAIIMVISPIKWVIRHLNVSRVLLSSMQEVGQCKQNAQFLMNDKREHQLKNK